MLKRLIPIILLCLGFSLFFVLDLHQYLSFATLRNQHTSLHAWKQQHYILATLLYIAIYSLATAISIPGSLILTITGGFLFGLLAGTIYTIIGANMGASCIFLATKFAFSDWMMRKIGTKFQQVKRGFNKNSISYLLFLRLVPIFPFWLINIISGLLGIPFKIFIITTMIGILPGTFVYVSVGNGLNKMIANQTTPNVMIIFQPHILLPILGLAILSLVPIIYKRWKKQGNQNGKNN